MEKNLYRFLNKKELALKYGVCLKTLSRWLMKIETKIPFYTKNQKLFSPIQIKKIDELLCYGED